MARKGVMDKLQRFARRVGLGFRPDEELPVDGIQWIDSQLDQPREFRRIASLSPPKFDFHTAKYLKKWPIAAFGHFIVGIENSAPARKPVGHRAVIVFIRV